MRQPVAPARDLIAGVSVALVLVPQSLAYAQLAGFPAASGLFAAAIPPLFAALLSSSPYAQPGPTAVTALLTFGALAPLASTGSARYVELGLLLALLVGVIRLGIGVSRGGVIAYLMSEPLLTGFIPAAALVIVASQLPVAFGTTAGHGNDLLQTASVLIHARAWDLTGAALAAGAVAVLLVGRRIWPLLPSTLVAIAGATAYAKLTHYHGPTVGDIDVGAPPVTTSLPLAELPHLLAPAVVIALVGFAEAASIGRTYAALDRRPWSANREFVSQGVANVAAAAFGGFPVGVSLSRSALNRLAGAKTSMSALVTGACVLAFLPLGFLLSPLPLAVLAAVVIVAVAPLIRLDRIVEVGRLSKPQFAVTASAFVLTLALAPRIDLAVIAAISLSIVIHLWRELRLDVSATSAQGELELVPEGVLWFGTAQVLEDRFVDVLSKHSDAEGLVIRLDRLGRIDLAGAFALKAIADEARQAGLHVAFQNVPAHSARILNRVLTHRHPIGSVAAQDAEVQSARPTPHRRR
jgi:sulfate permease, SulP family